LKACVSAVVRVRPFVSGATILAKYSTNSQIVVNGLGVTATGFSHEICQPEKIHTTFPHVFVSKKPNKMQGTNLDTLLDSPRVLVWDIIFLACDEDHQIGFHKRRI
jgi:hypothetical protein